MKGEIINNIEDCPDGCKHLKLAGDALVKDGVTVIIDCEHSEVCKIRNRSMLKSRLDRDLKEV